MWRPELILRSPSAGSGAGGDRLFRWHTEEASGRPGRLRAVRADSPLIRGERTDLDLPIPGRVAPEASAHGTAGQTARVTVEIEAEFAGMLWRFPVQVRVDFDQVKANPSCGGGQAIGSLVPDPSEPEAQRDRILQCIRDHAVDGFIESGEIAQRTGLDLKRAAYHLRVLRDDQCVKMPLPLGTGDHFPVSLTTRGEQRANEGRRPDAAMVRTGDIGNLIVSSTVSGNVQGVGRAERSNVVQRTSPDAAMAKIVETLRSELIGAIKSDLKDDELIDYAALAHQLKQQVQEGAPPEEVRGTLEKLADALGKVVSAAARGVDVAERAKSLVEKAAPFIPAIQSALQLGAKTLGGEAG